MGAPPSSVFRSSVKTVAEELFGLFVDDGSFAITIIV
jgi:hypothetical protein